MINAADTAAVPAATRTRRPAAPTTVRFPGDSAIRSSGNAVQHKYRRTDEFRRLENLNDLRGANATSTRGFDVSGKVDNSNSRGRCSTGTTDSLNGLAPTGRLRI